MDFVVDPIQSTAIDVTGGGCGNYICGCYQAAYCGSLCNPVVCTVDCSCLNQCGNQCVQCPPMALNIER